MSSPQTAQPSAGAPIGMIATVAGLALAGLAIVGLDWLNPDHFSSTSFFHVAGVVQRAVDSGLHEPSGVVTSFFSVVGLIELVLSAILALIAVWPRPMGVRRVGLRLLTALLIFAGLAHLVYADSVLADEIGSETLAPVGPSVASIGYLLAFVGVIVGPPRVRRAS